MILSVVEWKNSVINGFILTVEFIFCDSKQTFMNRRNFLKLNGILAIGAMLPKAVQGQSKQCTKSTYYGNISDDKQGEYWSVNAKLCEQTIFKYDAASEIDKILELNTTYYKHGISRGNGKKGRYQFEITSVSINDQTKTATCKGRIDEYDKEGYQFPKGMFNRKRITFTVKKVGNKRLVSISSKKGELSTLSRTISSGSSGSGSSGCYLTTAATEHQLLGDDCRELVQLRALRDQYMLQSQHGIDQIKEYYRQAPALVDKINSFENNDEIFNYMFHNMIQPAVALVENGQHEKAAFLYSEFSKALHKAYM